VLHPEVQKAILFSDLEHKLMLYHKHTDIGARLSMWESFVDRDRDLDYFQYYPPPRFTLDDSKLPKLADPDQFRWLNVYIPRKAKAELLSDALTLYNSGAWKEITNTSVIKFGKRGFTVVAKGHVDCPHCEYFKIFNICPEVLTHCQISKRWGVAKAHFLLKNKKFNQYKDLIERDGQLIRTGTKKKSTKLSNSRRTKRELTKGIKIEFWSPDAEHHKDGEWIFLTMQLVRTLTDKQLCKYAECNGITLTNGLDIRSKRKMFYQKIVEHSAKMCKPITPKKRSRKDHFIRDKRQKR